jgi:mRNA interferase MazF
MKVILEIKDSKAAFFMELLKNFSFVKAQPINGVNTGKAKAKFSKAGKEKADKEYEKEHKEYIEFSSYAMGLHDDDDEPDISHIKVKKRNPTFNLMLEGDVIKAFIMQANGEYKIRPVVLIKKLPYFDDWLVCGISSQTHTLHKGLDILIDKTHPDFEEIGLEHEMVIRAAWLYVYPQSKMEGDIGKISSATLEILHNNLVNFILKK